MSILSPEDLKKAIEIVKESSDSSIILDIGTYKWYNYYCNLHIKEGSSADLENEKLFKMVETELPELHKSIESVVDYLISKQTNDIDD